MATVNFLVKTKQNPSSIYVRFGAGRSVDISTVTGLSINPLFWDQKNQKIRNVIDVPNRDEINRKLTILKIAIVDDFNISYMNGEVIDKNWLDKAVNTFFNRPALDEKNKIQLHTIYYTDFAKWWIEKKAPRHKVSANKFMTERIKNHYNNLIKLVEKFEGKNKLRMSDITSEEMDRFSIYLTANENYAYNTARRLITRFKFFCERAEEENFNVNKNYKRTVFVNTAEKDYKDPYLNEDEINLIYKHDFSYNTTLDNVRDNLVIGLRTGLRISDFLGRLKIDNFQDGFIEIKTKKTGTPVAIPVHWQVEEILLKRKGKLPQKIDDRKFNELIKNIGQIVEIDKEMPGAVVVVDPKTKKIRKVFGNYPKYELLSSHVCRRSFATNLFGKIPNDTLMSICGWSSEQMLLKYIKKTNLESAKVLKDYWEKINH